MFRKTPRVALKTRGLRDRQSATYLFSAEVDLENVRRNYARDNAPSVVSRFAEQLTADFFGDAPSWSDVQPYVRFCLEPSDYETGFANTVHETVNDELVKVFVYISPDGSRITWVSNDTLAKWGVDSDAIVELANKNMNVVVPARDFAYIIPTANRDFLGRLGPVIIREYKESGHPISQDVLEVGDDDVTAIGSFAPKDG